MSQSLKLAKQLIKTNIQRRQIYNNSAASFSKLGATFNQRPVYHSNVKSNNFTDFKKIFSSIKVPSYLNSGRKNGLFGIEQLGTHEGFYDLKEKAEKRIKELIDETNEYDSSKLASGRNIVQIFDDISNELCRVADLAEFVRTSHPDIHFREAANLTFCSISQIVEKLNTNLKLYKKLKSEYDQAHNMDDCDRRVCKLFLIDFEQSGIHLDERTRNKFVSLNDQLIDYLTKFQGNTQTPAQINFNDIESKFKSLLVIF